MVAKSNFYSLIDHFSYNLKSYRRHAFFYNLKFSEDGELILGSGEENKHFNLSITNKFMLPTLANKGVFHIDGTYKITSHGYPLIVTGVTNIQG